MPEIDTDKFSATLREKSIDVTAKKVLITRLAGSEQEKDISEPTNCNGYGRVRHFRRETAVGWPENPLPIDPASFRLGVKPSDMLRSQVFQNAVCNWRCWYCYVPFPLLAGSLKHSAWFTAAELVDLYLQIENPPKVIDLSGGQPDLTPEWIVWMMQELEARGLSDKVYLWSDDNLSNDYLLRYLSKEDLEYMRHYRMYGKVCCFKGFDEQSFAFNTNAAPELFARQFEIFQNHLPLGLDLYGYATFTSPKNDNVKASMISFVDKLQRIHHNLPLRTIPLEIRGFSAMKARNDENAIITQSQAIEQWNAEIEKRFSQAERKRPIYEVPLTGNGNSRGGVSSKS
jgi:uncharacterized Fe-S cluster-containing radical SAM superfamily protein